MLWEHKLLGECLYSFWVLPNFREFVSNKQLDYSWVWDLYHMIIDEGAARVNYHA